MIEGGYFFNSIGFDFDLLSFLFGLPAAQDDVRDCVTPVAGTAVLPFSYNSYPPGS